MEPLVTSLVAEVYSTHLELVEPRPGPRLHDQLPEDDAQAEDVALCGHAAQLVVKALGRPGRRHTE